MRIRTRLSGRRPVSIGHVAEELPRISAGPPLPEHVIPHLAGRSAFYGVVSAVSHPLPLSASCARPAARRSVAHPAGAIREHHWDFARGALMLLGIPYHVAMCFRAGQPWIVASPRGGWAYTILSDFIHLFRMPAFFVVAGYFAALLLSRRAPAGWLRGRALRLGLPFLSALLLVVPVLNIFCELSGLDWPPAVASFHHNMATSGGYWIRHLWFLIVLLYYSALAAALVMLLPRLATARLEAGTRHPGVMICLIALAVGLCEAAAALPFRDIGSYASRWLQEIFRLDEALQYLPFFAFGAAIHRSAALRAIADRIDGLLFVIAMASTVAAIALQHSPYPVAATIVSGAAALLLTLQLTAAAKRWFDRPSPIVDRLVGASFVIYLLHLPVIAMLLDLVMPLGWSLAWQFAFVCGATLVICYAAALGIAAVPVLNLLLNGIVAPARPAAQPGGRVAALARK